MQIELLADVKNGVGEGPTWDDRRHCLWWTDIPNRILYRLDWPSRKLTSAVMPDRVGSLGLCESGRLVLAFAHGVALHEPGTQQFDEIAKIETDIPTNRMNDGKVGPDGAFWAGSMDENIPRQPTGALYRITMKGAVRQFDQVTVSNGLAWSLDGRTMIHADTASPKIDAFDFDVATGAISNRRCLAKPDNVVGRPDGGAFDVNGLYWSAGVYAGRLNAFNSAGALVHAVEVPTPHPTMPCFGGPDMKTVFLTSLRKLNAATDLDKWPASGGLFALDLGVAGVRVHRFKDQ
jgi:sugar lactone lactonase YvrE